MFTRCTASAVLACRLETGEGGPGGGLRLGGGFEVVGWFMGKSKRVRASAGATMLMLFWWKPGDSVMCGASSKLEVEARSLVVLECLLAIVWSIRNCGDAYLETGEGGPGGGLRLGGGFEVVGEIYEEVETGPGFYLVNADCVVLVAVGVGLVVEPESYAGRI